MVSTNRSGYFPNTPYIAKRYVCKTGPCPGPCFPSILGSGYVAPIRPFWKQYAEKVQLSKQYAAGRRLTWVSTNVNAFQSKEGAPGGSGAPPKNTF